jgi:hypothetical protein
VNDVRHVPPPPSQKKRKGTELPPQLGGTNPKRTKVSEPGGLVSNWKQSIGTASHITNKQYIEPTADDDEEDLVEGEFDRAEQPDMLDAVRASKPPSVMGDHSTSVSICNVSYHT